MSASRRSITSAAHPDARRALAVLAALTLLHSPILRADDAITGGGAVSAQTAVVSTVTLPSEKSPEGAVEPVESQHFTLLSTKRAVERSGVLETGYTAFMSVTNVPEARLPAHIRVVIFRKRADFQRITRSGGKARYADGEIASYEQKNMNSELVKVLAAMLFTHVARAGGRRELNWLQLGVVDAVEAAAARVPPEERQAGLREELKRERPVRLDEMVTQRVAVSREQVVDNLIRRKGRGAPGTAKRIRLTSVCLTYYLMALDKSLSFSYLLENLAEGKHLDDALSSAYPGKVRGLRELYDRWVTDEVGVVRPIRTPLP